MGWQKFSFVTVIRERADLLAQEIAHQVDVEIIPFAELARIYIAADVVSGCTGSLHQVIQYSDVKAALKTSLSSKC